MPKFVIPEAADRVHNDARSAHAASGGGKMTAVEQSQIDRHHENAVNTWDVLRVSIVALVVGLGIAILWELHPPPGHCLVPTAKG